MQTFTLPSGFPLPGIGTQLSPKDTMFDGRVSHYLEVGLSALQAIETAMGDAAPPRKILDLPCGHGRVTRVLRARFPAAAITCCDVDHEGALFAASQFGARAVLSSGSFSDLDLGGRFDLIWVGSLLTHLSELHARQFLDCLVRHMAPDAFLVMSSHGAYVADQMLSWDYGLGPVRARRVVEEHRATGYGYRDYHGSKGYGVSLISRQWIENALRGSPLRLIRYTERGWDDHQDIVVFRLSEQAMRSRRSTARLLQQAHAALASRWLGRPAPTGWFEAGYSSASARKGTVMSISPATDVLDEFDTAWYLAAYPDVAEAVQAKDFASAFEHYRSHGAREGRLPRAQDTTASCATVTEATPRLKV
jgi:SAM-dependent methyltransferase